MSIMLLEMVHICISYADDTALLIRGDDLGRLVKEAGGVFSSLKLWVEQNWFVLHRRKTSYVLIRNSQSGYNTDFITIKNQRINLEPCAIIGKGPCYVSIKFFNGLPNGLKI